MTKTYTQCVSGDNLSLENIFGIIIIQLQLKKCGETLNVASNARRLMRAAGFQGRKILYALKDRYSLLQLGRPQTERTISASHVNSAAEIPLMVRKL